jgi:hypothetical protein
VPVMLNYGLYLAAVLTATPEPPHRLWPHSSVGSVL